MFSSFMKMKTISKCTTVVNFFSVPIQSGKDIMMMRKLDVQKNREGIPQELLEKLSEYIDDDYYLIIAHKNVVRSF